MGESISRMAFQCFTGTGDFSFKTSRQSLAVGSSETANTEQLRLQQQGERLRIAISNAQLALGNKLMEYEKNSVLIRNKAKDVLRNGGVSSKRAAARYLRRYKNIENHLGFLNKLDCNLESLSFRIEAARTTADYGVVLKDVTSYIRAETATDAFNEDSTQDKVDEIIHMDSVVKDVNAALEELTTSMGMDDSSASSDPDGSLEAELQALMLEIRNEDSVSYKMGNPPPGGGGGTPIMYEESLPTIVHSSTITPRYTTPPPPSQYTDMKMCMPNVPEETPSDIGSKDITENLVEEKKGV
jgi:hypothetical protein